MHIKSLKLNNFRNYNNLNMNFSEKTNVLYGSNAQGKTNILEALFICASGRSHRTTKESELIKFNEPGFYIKIIYEKYCNDDSSIEISYQKDKKRKIRVNELPVNRIGELMGNFNAVIFSPEDLAVIKEGPSERRRFVDITLSQLKPSYFYDLQQYNKILLQRNTLIKNIQQKRSLIDTLDVWNNNLVNIGSRIIKSRNEFLRRLAKAAEENHYKLTNKNEKLNIKYSPSFTVENFMDIEEIKYKFNRCLTDSIDKEIIRGTTIWGPQRDDYEIFLDDISIRMYGSQGQQRTAVLSVKLSEIDIMREDRGEYPVLLLDDVMSELDIKRQEYLIKNLEHIQTFITCTDREIIDKRIGNDASFFYVKSGDIINQRML